jgi:RNase H-fold protein (predicted Holliday junction resolvase)
MPGAKTVLAIDPGSSKCGLALVHRNSGGKLDLLWRKIAQIEDLCAAIAEANAVQSFSMIILGNGTRSRDVRQRLREGYPAIGILIADEKDTTLQARERYWEHNPRRGWRRFLPATLQTPPEPVDDFVALILAERVLAH